MLFLYCLKVGVLLVGVISAFKQYEVNTSFGLFRMVFLINSKDDKKIAIECDGKDYQNNRGQTRMALS